MFNIEKKKKKKSKKKFPKTLSFTLLDNFHFLNFLKLKPLWKHVFYPLDFYKYEAFTKRITHV